jgi:hypothetical protein
LFGFHVPLPRIHTIDRPAQASDDDRLPYESQSSVVRRVDEPPTAETPEVIFDLL